MLNQEITDTEEPIKGGTSTNVDKTPLYQSNNDFLKAKTDEYNKRLTEFVTTAFTYSKVLPKVGGKTISSIDEIPKLIQKHGNDLYEQARTIKDNPDIDDDQAKWLLAFEKKTDDAFSYVAQANKIIYEDLANAAKHMDAKMSVKGWHTLLFNDKGQLKGPTQAKKDIDALRAQLINRDMDAWRKANPAPPQNSPMFWQRTDMPNPMRGQFYKEQQVATGTHEMAYDPVTRKVYSKPVEGGVQYKSGNKNANGAVRELDSRPKIQNSQEGYGMLEGQQFEIISYKYRNLNYDHSLKRVMEEYNQNSKTRKIKASEEGVFKDNAGNAKTTLNKPEFRFDSDDFQDVDESGKAVIKEEMKYAVNLLENLKDNPNVFFSKGSLDENSTVPDESNDKAQALVKVLYDDLRNNLLNVNRKKGSNKRPAGEISFVPIAGGDEKFHAYHIKLPTSYYDNYLGSENNPGIMRGETSIINGGVTIFVPAEESKKTLIGEQSIKGTTISPVEGLINLSPNNTYTRRIDGSMEYNISVDKKTGQYNVTGYAVGYNPDTFKMDTIPLNKLNIKSNYDMTVDIDEIDQEIFIKGLKNFEFNRVNKRENSRIRGIRDPKQLSGN